MLNNLQISHGKVVCPRCDGNGLVCKLIILPLNQVAYVCDECEATWFNEDIRFENFVNLAPYVESLGYNFEEIRYSSKDYDWYRTDEAD